MEEFSTINFFDALFDLSPDVLCLLNPDGYFLKLNKYFGQTTGYCEQDLRSKKFLELVHPDDVENTTEQWNNLLKSGTPFLFTNRYQCAGGLYKSLSWNVIQLPDKTVYASARDVSRNTDLQEQFYLNENRLQALIQSGNDVVGILSANGTYQYISPSVAHILNISPETFIGKLPYQFVHPEDAERIKNAFKYILSTTDTVHLSPFRVIDGHGNWHWLETFATNLLNDPAIAGIVVNSRDISIKVKDEEEKRLAAEQLRLSIERYKFVTEVTKDVIWDWNLETNKLSRERGFEKHFGYAAPNLSITSPNPWEAHLHPNDKDRIIKSIRAAIENAEEKFWKEEYRFIKADGTIAFITDKGYIIRNADKKAVRMVGAMHDNTELKEKEVRILKQNQTLREISQINSHVIRRPVATILGLMGILDKKAVSGKDNLEILECLEITTKELDMVIRRINDMSID